MNPPIEPPPGFFDNLPKLPEINPPLTEHEMSLVELAMNGAAAIRRLKKSQISNVLFHAIPKEKGPAELLHYIFEQFDEEEKDRMADLIRLCLKSGFCAFVCEAWVATAPKGFKLESEFLPIEEMPRNRPDKTEAIIVTLYTRDYNVAFMLDIINGTELTTEWRIGMDTRDGSVMKGRFGVQPTNPGQSLSA